MKQEGQKRKHRYTLNFTEKEYNEIKARARKSGLSLQEFSRLLLTSDIPDNVYELKARARDLEGDKATLQADLDAAGFDLNKLKELKEESARKDRAIAELEEKLSRSVAETKRSCKEPEAANETPSHWARILGSELTLVERLVLELGERKKEQMRQREKESEEELERWREQRLQKERETLERQRFEREERKRRRRRWI